MTALEDNLDNHQPKKITYQTDSGYPWEKSAGEISLADKDENVQGVVINRVNGQDLNWYSKIFGLPVFILIILTILLEVSYRRYFPLWPEAIIPWIFLGLRWLIFIIVPLIAFLKFKASCYQCLVSSISAAFIGGVIISLFQLFWYGELWTIFNLIGLPLLMIFESVIIALIIYGLIKIFK